jgi:predicted trehalose synthase
MRNQFFFTRTDIIPATETQAEQTILRRDSFNMDKVVRTVSIEKGIVVLLDDMAERETKEPVIDFKLNKVKGYKKTMQITQSEIQLSEQDAERFFLLTNIQQ